MEKFNISQFSPCKDGKEFYLKFDTFEDAWNNCHRGDWMLWIAKKLKVDLRLLTLAKGHCAATVLHIMKDERSKKAVEVAISFGEGKATHEQLTSAAADAADAADDAADAASYAAYAAAADADDAYAAYAAAAAADDASYANRKQTSDICRQFLTEEVFKIINKK